MRKLKYFETVEIKIEKRVVRIDVKTIYFHTYIAVSQEIIARMLQNFYSTSVKISLSFLISNWVLEGPRLEFPNIEKTDRRPLAPD